MTTPPRFITTLMIASVLNGCAGHAERTRDIRTALDVAQPRRALDLINGELEVGSARELPRELGGDNGLLLLDRAMVLQQLGYYRLSSRDLETADKQVEVLDLSRNAVHDLGRYLFSDEAGPYKAPAYEKLMINTMNMVNYLTRGDLNGARVEARRLAVMQKFIRDHEDPADALLGPGSYLAGFTFERSKQPEEALRYYDEALRYYDESQKLTEYRTLLEPVRRLASQTGYRSPRIRKLLKPDQDDGSGTEPSEPGWKRRTVRIPAASNAAQESDWGTQKSSDAANADESGAGVPNKPATPATTEKLETKPAEADATDGEILVVVGFGRVPAKYARRIPIGLALTYASDALSPYDSEQANYLAFQGLVSWINYPELGAPHGEYDTPEFALDGKWQALEGVLELDREAKRAWQAARGAVVGSAITRLVSRIVVGETVRQAAGKGLTGALLSLGTQATLTAFDTPDTRSWSTLPARLALGRVRVAAGEHQVFLRARGLYKRQRVTIAPGGWAVVTLTALM